MCFFDETQLCPLELGALLLCFVSGFSRGKAKVKVATSAGDTYVEALQAAAELISGQKIKKSICLKSGVLGYALYASIQ